MVVLRVAITVQREHPFGARADERLKYELMHHPLMRSTVRECAAQHDDAVAFGTCRVFQHLAGVVPLEV